MKYLWCFVLVTVVSQIHAYTNVLSCDEVDRSENCTISNIIVDAEDPSFDYSRFNENHYAYHYGYQYLKNIVKYITFIDSTLYELPTNLFVELPHTAYLLAPNCSITKISKSEFDSASNLKKLLLQSNQIEIIHHMVFWGAPKLLELNLASNRIADIKETAFHNLGKLVELNLANNQISEVKSEFFRDLKSLKFITLAQNKIATIDSDLFDNNVLLEIIRLNDNQIVSVGESFLMRQSNVKYLYLLNNLIEELSSTAMKAMTVNLENNKLEALQIGADNLRVFASRNRISNLTIEDQAKVTHLYLAENKISDISSVLKLPTLQFLDLSGNSVGALSLDKFSNLTNLIHLGLSYTNISNLEYGTFSHLPDLTKLDISYNSLKRIDMNIFTSLTSLETLALDGNDLTEMAYKDIKHTLPKLESISISDNDWNCTYLTDILKTLASKDVTITIDPAKFVRNSTNQKGIACRDNKDEHLKHWQGPTLKFDANLGDGTNASEYLQEMTKSIDKLIASINTTDVEDLRKQVDQLQERLEFLEKKLTDQDMKLVKTQLQIATTNSTQQAQSLGHIHTLVDQLNNLTLQRQQLSSDVLSQKIYELNYNVDRNAKNVERLEAIVKISGGGNGVNGANGNKGYADYQRSANETKTEGSAWINVSAVLIVIILAMYCGFQVMVHYKSRQNRKRMSAFSNRTSIATLEQEI